jgi:hypothetical protein
MPTNNNGGVVMKMMTRKWLRIVMRATVAATVLVGATVSATVNAAEITFYEYAGFGGRSLTLRGYSPDFDAIGFNDRAASIVIRSGTWQVCTDANFGGTCATLTPGEYRALDGRFDSKISSAKETGTYGDRTGGYTNYRRGAVELFEGVNFTGASVILDQDIANFSYNDFNDRAASMIVRDGTWELCVHANYTGACRAYGRGRYADLGPGMSRQASSARLTGGYADAPYVIGGDGSLPQNVGGGGPGSGIFAGVNASQVGRAILFDADGSTGRSMVISENMVDLTNTGFNDQAVSLVIESGVWELCTDAYFRGQCRTFTPGSVRRFEAALYRTVSSMRLVGAANAGGRPLPRARPPQNRVDVEVFEHSNFEGRRLSARGNVSDLQPENFNDIISSIVIYAGQWEFCTDANYSGRCVVFGVGQHPNVFGLNDQFSSFRRVDR